MSPRFHTVLASLVLLSAGCAEGPATSPPGGPAGEDQPNDPVEAVGEHPFELLGAVHQPGTHAYNAAEWLDDRYVLSAGGGSDMRVVDTTTLTATIVGEESTVDVAFDPTTGSAWVALDRARAVSRYDMTDPTAPVLAGSLGGLADTNVSIVVDNGLALVGTTGDAVLIHHELEVAAYLEADLSYGVALQGGRALVADGEDLVLWDVSRPHMPQILHTVRMRGEGREVAFDGNRIAVALGCSGVELFELVEGQLVSVDHIDLPECTFSVDLEEDSLWIAAWSGVWVARLDAAGPVLLGEHPSSGSAMDVAVRDGVAAVGELQHLELVAQVSDVGGPEITTPKRIFWPRSAGAQTIQIRNDGAAPLEVDLASADYTTTIDRLTIPPGKAHAVTLAAPGTLGKSVLKWQSSDPDEPDGEVEILLADEGVGQPQTPFSSMAFNWPRTEVKPLRDDMLEGQVVVLSFFRPSCLICTIEAPDIYATMQNYMLDHPDDFQLIWVAVQEDMRSAWEFMNEYRMSVPCILDNQGDLYFSYALDDDGSTTGVAVPMNVVIDRDGVVRYLSMETNLREITAAIDAALSPAPQQMSNKSAAHEAKADPAH